MSQSQSTPRARVPTHFERAKEDLLDLVARLGEQGASRLPAESQLSQELGFSRPTVRSALLALEIEGKLQRLHGVGTFINRHALGITANLAEDQPFMTLLERLGYEASADILSVETQPLTAERAVVLDAPEGEPACVITRVYRASGEPAVLSRDYVPLRMIKASLSDISPERSTFAFIERWCGRKIRYSVTKIRPTAPGPPTTDLLDLPVESPLLLLDHLHIDNDEEAVCTTEAFVNDDYIVFTVVRTETDL